MSKMSTVHGRRLLESILLAGAALLPMHALAQAPEQATDTKAGGLTDIVVTARKTEERLQDVPVAVTALGSEQLEARSMADLRDVGRFTPNVYFSNIGSASPHQAAVFIRGIGQAEGMITGDPGVGLYVDGVYYGRSQGGIMDLLDLDRVEVLRGPQGTLFGKNTIGGAINVVSRAPVGDGSGQVSLTVGNYKRLEAGGAIDLGLAEGLSLKVSGLSRNRGCLYNRASDGACYGDISIQSGRAFLRYKPEGAFTADLIVDVTHSRQHALPHGIIAYNPNAAGIQDYNAQVLAGTAPGPQLLNTNPEIASSNPYATEGTLPTDATLEAFGSSLHLQYDLGGAVLHSISAFRKVSARSVENSDGSRAEYAEVPSFTKAKQFTQELRLDGSTLDGRLDYVAGLYYFWEKGSTFESVLAPYVFGGLGGAKGWEHDNRQVSKSYAAFLHSSFAITDSLRLTADIRYTKDRKRFTGGRKSVTSPTFDQVPLTTTTASWGVWTPKFGLDYKVTPDLLVYASASRGYRSGGFNGRAESVLAVSTPYNPEYVWSYEAGIKSQFLDNRVRLNLAAFTSDYKDRQQTILRFIPGTTTFAPIVANAANARVKGFEAELTALLTPRFLIEGNVGYTDAKFTKVDPSVTDITLNSVVTFVPKWTASAAAQYTIPAAGLNGEIIARVDYSFRDKVSFNPTPTIYNTQGAISLVNARLGYKSDDGAWDIALYGRNLTNKRYKLWANDLYDSAFGLAFAWYSDPREYGVTIKRSF